MSTKYVSYQCTVCRQSKDIVEDSYRVLPNLCTITPGCSGRLLFVGEKSQSDVLSPSSKLVNSPNDRMLNPIPLEKQESISLSTSSFGSLTIAVKWSTTALQSIKLKLIQRKAYDIPYQQYIFRTVGSTTSITPSTKDVSGKFLRFDAAAISEKRVQVIVNGVTRDQGSLPNQVVLAANTVTFNTAVPAASTVSVIVFSEQTTIERILNFDLNSVKMNTDIRFGAWSNIGKASLRPSDFPNEEDWFLYSCTFLTDISYSTKSRIDSVLNLAGDPVISGSNLSNVRFLLAQPPYSRLDRIYNFVVGVDKLSTDYNLLSSSSGFVELSTPKDNLTEIYPPIEIKNSRSHFIVADTYESVSSTATADQNLVSSKIIGPI